MNPPTNPRMHVVNPGEEKKKSERWETAKTVAFTTLVTMAVGGIGYAGWKLASRRFTRIMRRQNAEQEAVAAASAVAGVYPYQQAAGYPGGSPAYPGYATGPQYAYAPPQYQPPIWPSQAVREQMPDALREVPTFHPHAAPPPVMPVTQVQPNPTVMQAPPLAADPTFRKFMTELNGRFSSIDQRLSQINDQLGDDGDGDDDDDDEEDERPRRSSHRGGN